MSPTTSPATSSTSRRFLSSTLASYWSLGVRLVVTMGARLLLARLLIDEDFGLYDLALRVVTIAGAVRDLGLTYHLMRDDRRPYGTVFAFSVISGGVVTALLVLAAPLFGGYDVRLPEVLQVFAFWVLLDGLVSVPRTYFERELAIARLVGPEIARGLLMAAVSLLLAQRGWGVWSLVAGDLASTALFAVWVGLRARGRMPLNVEPALLPGLLKRGNLLFWIWVLFQLVTYIDSFLIGLYRELGEVGVYGRAWFLAFLVRQIVFPRALVPALVEYRGDPERFALAFRVGTIFLLFCEVTAGYFLFFNAERVVAILLGGGWEGVVPLLKILCFVPFLDVFSELGGEVLKVCHEDRVWLLIMILNLTSLVGFGIAFTREHGAAGMAWANFLLLGNLIMAWRMKRIFAGHFARLLLDMGWVYVVPLALLGAAAFATEQGTITRLLLSLAACLGSGGLLAWRYWELFRRFLEERKGA